MKKITIIQIILFLLIFNLFSGPKENKLLMYAAQNNIKKVKQIVADGADINAAKKITRNTALMIAVKRRNFEMIKFLVENGADINKKNKKENTALHLTANYKIFISINTESKTEAEIEEMKKEAEEKTIKLKSEYFNIAKYLTDNGADVNIKNIDGNTPLHEHFKSNKKSLEITNLFLELMEDIDAENDDKNTPLILAARSKDLELIKLIHKKGADINHTNIDDSNALMVYLISFSVPTREEDKKQLLDGINYFIDNGINMVHKRRIILRSGDKEIDVVKVAEDVKTTYVQGGLISRDVLGLIFMGVNAGLAKKHYDPIIDYLKKKQQEYMEKNNINSL